jgi:hypothetical protein
MFGDRSFIISKAPPGAKSDKILSYQAKRPAFNHNRSSFRTEFKWRLSPETRYAPFYRRRRREKSHSEKSATRNRQSEIEMSLVTFLQKPGRIDVRCHDPCRLLVPQ